MKLLLSILLVSVLCLYCNLSKAQSYVVNKFGDSTIIEKGISVYQFQNGEIYYLGYSKTGQTGDAQVSLLKLDVQGHVIWEKNFGSTDNEYPYDMIWNGTSFLVVGSKESFVNGDGFIMSIDTSGNLLAFNTIGTTQKTEMLHSIAMTSDSGYICTGFTSSGPSNNFYTLKLDKSLSLAWRSTYGSNENEVGMRVIELSNGNFFVTGDQAQPTGNYNIYTQCIAPNGSLIWDKTISSSQNGGSKNMIINDEGYALIVGEMNTPTSNAFDIVVIKMNPQNGNLLWSNYATNHTKGDAGFAITEPIPNHYVITGYGTNPLTNNQDIVLLSIDSLGNQIDAKYYGDSLAEIAYTIRPSINGGFLLAGFSSTPSDMQYVFVYDNLLLSTSPPPSKPSFTLYPNPNTSSTIYFSKNINNAILNVYDSKGQLIECGKVNNNNHYSLHQKLPFGIYFIQIIEDSSQHTFKVVWE